MKKTICCIIIFMFVCVCFINNSPVIAVQMAGGELTGEIKLTADTTLTSTIKIPANKTLTLDLNGYVLDHYNDERPIVVNLGATLTIKDSNPSRAHYGSLMDGLWVYNSSSTKGIKIEGGIITGGVKSDRGGAIFNKGTVIMEGGTIAGCKAIPNSNSTEISMQNYLVNTFTNGTAGAIFIDETASFTMNGGAIRYCKSSPFSEATLSGGGAVFVDANANKAGTFTMNNGEISNCSSLNGGAVYVHSNLTAGNTAEQAAVFNMTGGKITDCHSTNTATQSGGGAVYVNATQAASGSVASIGKFNMSGGTLEKNTSDSMGGAVYLLGYFNMYDGVEIAECTTKNTGTIVDGKKIYSGWGGAVAGQQATSKFIMNGGTITDCIGASGGAVTVFNSGTFTMEDGNIKNCKAYGDTPIGFGNGGAIYLEYATVNINGGTIDNCEANRYGGAINTFKNGKFTMNGGTISNSNASSAGGIYAREATILTMNGGKILNCRAESTGDLGNGGAVYVHACTFNFNNGTLEGNYAKRCGGAINISRDAQIYINGACKIINNTAYDGGGIAQETEDCQIGLDNSEILIKGNSASNNGGGLFVKSGNISISACTIEENSASGNGGFLYITEGSVNMSGGSILNSSATNGGAVYMEAGSFEMTSGRITDNTATNDGGAVSMIAGDITIGLQRCGGNASSHVHPVVINNTASDYGGGISITSGNLNMYCGSVRGNLYMGGSALNNIDQSAGNVNVYGGSIDGGIAISSGTFIDHTKETASTAYNVTYHSEDGTGETSVATVTADTVLTLLGNVFERDGYYLIGWKTDLDSSEIMYVGSVYKIENTANLYAVWGTEEPIMAYYIYIPATIEIDETQKQGTITISSILKYFTNLASVTVYIDGKDDLVLDDISISYTLKNSDDEIIENGDSVATFSNVDQSKKEIGLEITGQAQYAGVYTDILTFSVTYDSGL